MHGKGVCCERPRSLLQRSRWYDRLVGRDVLCPRLFGQRLDGGDGHVFRLVLRAILRPAPDLSEVRMNGLVGRSFPKIVDWSAFCGTIEE